VGLDLFQGLAAPGELGEDRFDGGMPDERFGIFIPCLQEFYNGRNQVGHAGKGVAVDALGGKFSKPALDQVEPTATGGHEVKHEMRMLVEPGFDLGTTVSAIVVDYQMQAEVGRERTVQTPQEAQKFLVSMTLVPLSNDLALKQFDRGEQGGRAIAFVVAGHGAAKPLFSGRPGWVRSSA
jgi:hypothetical protein